MKGIKKWLALFTLSFGYASMYVIPYAKYVYYDPMMEALNCTNFQLGLMVSVYVLIGIFTFIPGGWVADRFSARKTIAISLVVQGLLTTWFALQMTMAVGWIVWVAFAFTNCFAYWSAALKGVRMLGDKGEQGKLYGFFEAGYGLASVIISFIGLAIFSRYVDQVAGFKMVVLAYSMVSIIAGILTWVLYEDYMVETNEKAPKVGLKDVIFVLKQPIVWLIAIVIMTTYGLYVGQTYLTPYLTAVMGITVTFSGIIAVIRTYGVKLVAGPIGGAIADKWNSPCKVLVIGYVVTIAMLFVFLFLPSQASLTFIIVLMLVIALFGSAMKGIMWSTVEEAKVPRYYTGLAIGTASVIGYLPDVVYGPLFGFWLDSYGNGGYNLMFAFLIGMSVLGLLATIGILKTKKRAFSTVPDQSAQNISDEGLKQNI